MCAYRYVAERTCGGGSQPASLRVGWNLSGRLELCLVHAMVLRGTTHSKARIKIIVKKNVCVQVRSGKDLRWPQTVNRRRL